MPNLADVCRIGPNFEHSPIPWYLAEANSTIPIRSGNKTVASVRYGPTDNDDAQFIVRAVNAHDDLLAALREIESWTYAALHTKAGQPDNFGGEARKCNEIARAAIAKTEGR